MKEAEAELGRLSTCDPYISVTYPEYAYITADRPFNALVRVLSKIGVPVHHREVPYQPCGTWNVAYTMLQMVCGCLFVALLNSMT